MVLSPGVTGGRYSGELNSVSAPVEQALQWQRQTINTLNLDAVSAMGKKWCKQINGNSSFMGVSYKMKGMQNMNGVMRRKA